MNQTTALVPRYFQHTRPYGVIDAINRMALATGSCAAAMAGHGADYNGHRVNVYFNTYRGYWLADYTWSGRNVLARGTLRECLEAAKREYARGALGAETIATYPESIPSSDRAPAESVSDFHDACQDAGLVSEFVEGPDMAAASWRTALHDKVNDAMRYEHHGLAPAVGFLANSKTVEEYEAKLEAHFAERRAAAAPAVQP